MINISLLWLLYYTCSKSLLGILNISWIIGLQNQSILRISYHARIKHRASSRILTKTLLSAYAQIHGTIVVCNTTMCTIRALTALFIT
jgi:hypothetical protein